MATTDEAAAFSLYVYRDKEQPPLPEGWEIFMFCPEELRNVNYYGIAFIKKISAQVNLITIAHRGTILSPSVLFDDLLFYLNIVPECIEMSALKFCDLVARTAQEKFPNSFVIGHTGHSLGAIIATLCCLSRYNPTKHVWDSAEVFECPGAGELVNSWLEKGRLNPEFTKRASIGVINADVNAINSCKKQFFSHMYGGGATKVGFNYADVGEEVKIPDKPSMLYYLTYYTLQDQHKMVKLYNYFNKHPNTLKTNINKEWPVGFEAGYKNWTDLTNSSLDKSLQHDYWLGYTKTLWKANPEIHKEYEDLDYKFQAWFFKQYLKQPNQLEQLPTANCHQLFNNAHHNHLIKAIEKNNIDAVIQFLNQSTDINYSKDWQKRTALHIAVMYGNLDIIRVLLKNKFDPEAKDILGNTAFHVATLHHDGEKLLAITRLLTEFKADPDKQNLANMMPYDILKIKQAYSSQSFFELTNEDFVLIENNEDIETNIANKQEGYQCSIM